MTMVLSLGGALTVHEAPPLPPVRRARSLPPHINVSGMEEPIHASAQAQ
jgi:hypothetical protein